MKIMDNCGVCGGDNLFCHQINKYFNKPAAKGRVAAFTLIISFTICYYTTQSRR